MDTRPLFTDAKRFYLPRVDKKEMEFFRYLGEDSLATGAFGIKEPKSDEAVPYIDAAVPKEAGCPGDQRDHTHGSPPSSFISSVLRKAVLTSPALQASAEVQPQVLWCGRGTACTSSRFRRGRAHCGRSSSA